MNNLIHLPNPINHIIAPGENFHNAMTLYKELADILFNQRTMQKSPAVIARLFDRIKRALRVLFLCAPSEQSSIVFPILSD
jgi:hypothetical protein